MFTIFKNSAAKIGKFNYYGLELKGFAWDVFEATTPAKAQEFILLAHPDTPDDVSQKIEQYGRGLTPI